MARMVSSKRLYVLPTLCLVWQGLLVVRGCVYYLRYA